MNNSSLTLNTTLDMASPILGKQRDIIKEINNAFKANLPVSTQHNEKIEKLLSTISGIRKELLSLESCLVVLQSEALINSYSSSTTLTESSTQPRAATTTKVSSLSQDNFSVTHCATTSRLETSSASSSSTEAASLISSEDQSTKKEEGEKSSFPSLADLSPIVPVVLHPPEITFSAENSQICSISSLDSPSATTTSTFSKQNVVVTSNFPSVTSLPVARVLFPENAIDE